MSSKNFFAELKRRNVYKVAIAYGRIAWLLIQIATQTFPVLRLGTVGDSEQNFMRAILR